MSMEIRGEDVLKGSLGNNNEKKSEGRSLAAQWLGHGAFTAMAWVRSPVRELRSHKPHGTAKREAPVKRGRDGGSGLGAHTHLATQ